MKFNKKIMVSILGIVILSNLLTNRYVQASNDVNIVSILNSEEYDSIKRITEDDEGNPIDAELVNTKNKNSLSDGVYVIDYKEGWVLGKDKGFLKSIIVPAGAKGGLSVVEEKGVEYKISVQATASFGTEFIKATVKAGYGYSFGESKQISVYQSIQADDKNLFVKAQTIYRRFDVMRVKNNVIIDRAISYQPVSFALRNLEFSEGEKVIQSKLYETQDRNILGEPDYTIKQVISPDTEFEGEFNLTSNSQTFWSTQKYVSTTPVGLYFIPTESGTYKINDTIYGFGWAGDLRMSGVGLKLYKVNDDNGVELIASRTRQLTEIASKDYAATPLVASDLKAGQKYVLVINEEGHKRFFEPIADRLEYIKYRIKFEK